MVFEWRIRLVRNRSRAWKRDVRLTLFFRGHPTEYHQLRIQVCYIVLTERLSYESDMKSNVVQPTRLHAAPCDLDPGAVLNGRVRYITDCFVFRIVRTIEFLLSISSLSTRMIQAFREESRSSHTGGTCAKLESFGGPKSWPLLLPDFLTDFEFRLVSLDDTRLARTGRTIKGSQEQESHHKEAITKFLGKYRQSRADNAFV